MKFFRVMNGSDYRATLDLIARLQGQQTDFSNRIRQAEERAAQAEAKVDRLVYQLQSGAARVQFYG